MSVDRDRLVDLITRKVMEELSGGGIAAPPAPTAPGRAEAAPRKAADAHDHATCERCSSFGVST